MTKSEDLGCRIFYLAIAFLVIFIPQESFATCPPPVPGFQQPECIYSENGILDTVLEMGTATIDVGPRILTLATYNQSLPGPTLRVKQGDTLRILLKNAMTPLGIPKGPIPPGFLAKHNLPAGLGSFTKQEGQIYTNLHTHGLQVSPSSPADNVLLIVKPGECNQYEYHIRDGDPAVDSNGLPTPPQPAGLHWYHPHFHGSTTHQGWQGLSGAIVIEGDIDEVPEVKVASERLLILNELWVGEDGTVPTALVVPNAGWSPFTAIPATQTNILFTINGQYQPTMKIQQNETQRWRVLAAGPHRFFHFEVEGHSLYQIAQDGVPFAKPKKVQRILLAAGNRAEFIIKGGKAGNYQIRALAYDQGHPGGPRPERLLGTLVSEGKAKQPGKIPDTLVKPFVIPPKLIKALKHHPERHRTISFQGDISQAPVSFTVNNKSFELDPKSWWETQPADPRPIPGTVEEWTLINEDVFQHPFHIHVNPFQIIEINGAPTDDNTWNIDPNVWWDVFRLPSRKSQNDPPTSVKLRIYFRPDAPGLTVFHCHILPHEDNGMMGTVFINKNGDQGTITPQLTPQCAAVNSEKTGGVQ